MHLRNIGKYANKGHWYFITSTHTKSSQKAIFTRCAQFEL